MYKFIEAVFNPEHNEFCLSYLFLVIPKDDQNTYIWRVTLITKE